LRDGGESGSGWGVAVWLILIIGLLRGFAEGSKKSDQVGNELRCKCGDFFGEVLCY